MNVTIFSLPDRNFETLELFQSWGNDLPRCSKNLASSCHGIQDASKRVNPGWYSLWSKPGVNKT